MRYLKSIYEEAKSYDFQIISYKPELISYSFTDIAGNDYLVEFKNIQSQKKGILSTTYELVYFVRDESGYSVSKIVNVNIYSVLQTIFRDILRDFLQKNSWVKTIFFVGLSKEREREYISTRTKVYMRYLERNPIPGFRINQSGNTIQLIRFQ